MMRPTLARQRRRAWHLLVSALAGSGLTAASLNGLFTAGAHASSSSPAPSEPGSVPLAVSESGSGSSGSGSRSSGEHATTTITTTTTTPQPTTSTAKSPPPQTAPESPPPKAPAVVRQRTQQTTTAPAPKTTSSTKPPSSKPTGASHPAAAGANNVAPAPQIVAAQAGLLAAELAGATASTQALAYYRIPLFLLPIYQAAAAQYGVPWQILAAINEIETDYGNDLSVSTAGAVGWMQFMPATWIQYGVDALNAGYADPYNPVDAIFAAARYLRAAGALSNLRAAILAYNHSAEYVSSVLLRAKLISAYPNGVIATLTGLIDGRLPVRNERVAWDSIARLVSPSSATAKATAVPGGGATHASTPSGSAPPAPAAAAAAAANPAAHPPRLLDLVTSPNATVVAVQDGRIVKVGGSSQLGKYVVLRDVYGDVFTYAGLGSIAPSYQLPPPAQRTGLLGAGAKGSEALTRGAAGAEQKPPITLKVSRPLLNTPGHVQGARAHANPAPAAAAAARGKVRLFAHPGNPDALAATAGSGQGASRHSSAGQLPLRAGAVVAKGTVLGHVRTPAGARAGHLRFAIRPAGDLGTIDPRPILQNWSQLGAALHPQGASRDAELLGATATGTFLLSKADLQRDVLSDPGIQLSACGRREIAAGVIDKRVLALVAFLSRSGLKPTVSTLRCGTEVSVGDGSAYRAGEVVDISALDGIAVAAHQGPGTITDATIRTLLTLQGEFVPHRIVSLMQFPGAANTQAAPLAWDRIHVAFAPLPPGGLQPARSARSARAAHSAASRAPVPLVLGGNLSSPEWDRLITRVGALPAPKVATKPSSPVIRDPKQR